MKAGDFYLDSPRSCSTQPACDLHAAGLVWRALTACWAFSTLLALDQGDRAMFVILRPIRSSHEHAAVCKQAGASGASANGHSSDAASKAQDSQELAEVKRKFLLVMKKKQQEFVKKVCCSPDHLRWSSWVLWPHQSLSLVTWGHLIQWQRMLLNIGHMSASRQTRCDISSGRPRVGTFVQSLASIQCTDDQQSKFEGCRLSTDMPNLYI